MIPTLEHRALTAATTVAAAHGVACDGALVLYSGSNVLVHLRPAPLVARVMTGTVVLHDDLQRWLAREVAVLTHLIPSGLAVTPSALLPPGPHCHDGLWMTFAAWVAGVAPAPERDAGVSVDEAAELGRRLGALHAALRSFDGPLGDMRELGESIERLLDRLRPGAAIAELRARLRALGADVFTPDHRRAQPLHGDVSLRNLLRTPRGVLWNDFEDTLRGPVHWDLASAVGSVRQHGGDARCLRALLGAYGWDDPPALAPFLAAQDLYDEIWGRYERQRRAPAEGGP